MKKILISYKSLFVLVLFIVISFGFQTNKVEANFIGSLNATAWCDGTNSYINLNWSQIGQYEGYPQATYWNILRNSTYPYAGTTAADVTTWRDTNLRYATSYNYSVYPDDRDNPSDSITVISKDCSPLVPPTVSLTVAAGFGTTNVAPGSYSMLYLSTTNASSCSAIWMNGNGTSGNINVGPINDPTTYTISCTGAGGKTEGSISFTVTAPATPTGFTATAPTNTTCGSNWINIAWYKSTGATNYKVYRDGSIIYNGDGTDKWNGSNYAFSDSDLVLGSSHTYTITASNTGGTSAVGNTSPTPSVVQSACPYTISATSGVNCSVTPTGNTIKSSGSSQTYSITPSANYSISSVLVDNSSVGAVSSYTFSNITANHTISATCSSVPPPNCSVSTDTNYNIGPCSGTCKNGAPVNTYPTCTIIPPPPSDACGTSSGTTPRLSEPTTNPTACNPGAYANSPADITTSGSQAWRWSCGVVNSCTAPKFGCRITTDTNYSLAQYGATGPNNNYGCASTCANGAPVNTYPTCTINPGVTTVSLSYGGSKNPVTVASGGSVNFDWSATNVSSCKFMKNGAVYNNLIYSSGGPNTPAYSATFLVPNNTASANYNVSCVGYGTVASNVMVVNVTSTTTTATIKVNSNVATSWTINPGNISGSGTSKTHTVNPSVPASSYTIVADPVNGYSGPVISNDKTGNSPTFSLSAGDTGIFDLTYSPIGCTNCPPGFNYSLSSAASLNAPKGDYSQITIFKKLLSGTASQVYLSLSSVPSLPTGPSGITSSISANPGVPCDPACPSVVNFGVQATAEAKTYHITVTGQPGDKTASFDLVVDSGGGGGGGGGNPLSVLSCAPSRSEAKIGEIITWTANVSGGAPPYRFTWVGSGMPIAPNTPTANPYSLTYSTVGKKGAEVTVTDELGNRKVCTFADTPGVLIKFNPTTIEER